MWWCNSRDALNRIFPKSQCPGHFCDRAGACAIARARCWGYLEGSGRRGAVQQPGSLVLPQRNMTDLKLIALDAEDLAVVSAHLQDGVLRVADMTYLPRERRFAALLNRFDWGNAAVDGGKSRRHDRQRSALRFERVTFARVQGFDLKSASQVLSLLSIQFEASTAPAGVITLVFAGGAGIQLGVECIEAELKDLGARWRARAMPDHGPEHKPTPTVAGGAKKTDASTA